MRNSELRYLNLRLSAWVKIKRGVLSLKLLANLTGVDKFPVDGLISCIDELIAVF